MSKHKRKKQNPLLMILVGILSCICLVFLGLIFSNEKYIEFNVLDGFVVEAEYGTKPELPKVKALCKGTIFNKEGTPVEVTAADTVDDTKIGSYLVTYSAQQEDISAQMTVNVIIKDTQAPEITLVTNPETFTSPIAEYEEEGFLAVDNYDGDITDKVERKQQDGKVIYTVSDSSGNKTTVERNIVYKDAVKPTIQLKGDKKITLMVGAKYSEPGFSASDDCDGDITNNVIVEGSVDTEKAGTYTMVYKVADSSGNMCEVTRTVTIKKPASTSTSSNEKVIYLTFDDGPGPYTKRLLDILDKYGVKVTFFVTGGNSDYYDMIGEAYRRGHTIALHTFSHKYSIYKSVDTYYADLKKISDLVVKQTGEKATIVRFPGGTSNRVSENYCDGIMTMLSKDLSKKGYLYCDWNVSSGDAGDVSTEKGVYNNVIKGVSKQKVSIVLQHDIKSYSVDAVDDIIEWGLENGYTFKAMDENTSMVHHKPNN